MDVEKLLFIAIAIALSFFSMYKKAKNKKQTSSEHYTDEEPIVILEHNNAENLFKNSNYSAKKSKKATPHKKSELKEIKRENQEFISQNIDSEKETILLEDFDGTEIQKAFLYSEIFKNAKN